MKFPNAYAGVKKIFTAEILSLIASACGILAVVFTYFLSESVVDKQIVNEGTAAVSLGGATVFLAAASVLGIIAFIFTILGTKSGAVDEPAFKTAFNLILIGIVVGVVGGILSSVLRNHTVNNVFNLIGDIINFAVTIFIIQAIRNLAVRLGNKTMDKKGNDLFKLVIAIYVIILIAGVVIIIVGGKAGSIVAGIVGIISGILEIVLYVLYLLFLNNAKKMLA